MLRAMATVQTTIMYSVAVPTTNDTRQTSTSGHSRASPGGFSPTPPPTPATASIGRRGARHSDSRPPATRPTDSAAMIAPQAAGPPSSALATTGPSTSNPPNQAIMTTQYWATMTHSQVWDQNSDQPSRRSRSMLLVADGARATPALMLSSMGTVAVTPAPQMVRAQPGPTAATTTPATAAPLIMAMFMASRLSALACCSSSAGTSAGRSACDAG